MDSHSVPASGNILKNVMKHPCTAALLISLAVGSSIKIYTFICNAAGYIPTADDTTDHIVYQAFKNFLNIFDFINIAIFLLPFLALFIISVQAKYNDESSALRGGLTLGSVYAIMSIIISSIGILVSLLLKLILTLLMDNLDSYNEYYYLYEYYLTNGFFAYAKFLLFGLMIFFALTLAWSISATVFFSAAKKQLLNPLLPSAGLNPLKVFSVFCCLAQILIFVFQIFSLFSADENEPSFTSSDFLSLVLSVSCILDYIFLNILLSQYNKLSINFIHFNNRYYPDTRYDDRYDVPSPTLGGAPQKPYYPPKNSPINYPNHTDQSNR